jgi:hypothetical protein
MSADQRGRCRVQPGTELAGSAAGQIKAVDPVHQHGRAEVEDHDPVLRAGALLVRAALGAAVVEPDRVRGGVGRADVVAADVLFRLAGGRLATLAAGGLLLRGRATLLRVPPGPGPLAPCLDASGELAIRAARALDIPLSRSDSYCFSFLMLGDGMTSPPRRTDLRTRLDSYPATATP